MKGYVDLHGHYLPGLDDGVSTVEEGVRLCKELYETGCDVVVATPHVRTAMYENSRSDLIGSYQRFLQAAEQVEAMPKTALAAEYFCNDVFWQLWERGEALTYPGGRAVLVELPPEQVPLKVEERFFRMNVKGIRPVLAHPERYPFLFRTTRPIESILQAGVLPLLDLMSLTGRHGNAARRAAERMLEEGVYYAACTDAHRADDVQWVRRGIERLQALMGEQEARELLADNPRQILEGTVA